MGNIKTKTWDAPREEDDGFRLLTCRYRPRALPKKKETWSLWWKQLGPSIELHAAYYGKKGQEPIDWETFSQRYREEMKEQDESIAVLAEKVVSGVTLTLLCSSACTDPKRCHRFLLKELIEAKVAELVPHKQSEPAPLVVN